MAGYICAKCLSSSGSIQPQYIVYAYKKIISKWERKMKERKIETENGKKEEPPRKPIEWVQIERKQSLLSPKMQNGHKKQRNSKYKWYSIKTTVYAHRKPNCLKWMAKKAHKRQLTLDM